MYHITFFFGDAVVLLLESYTLVYRNSCVSSCRRSPCKSRVYFRWVACICPFQAKINFKFHVTLRSLIGLVNCSSRVIIVGGKQKSYKMWLRRSRVPSRAEAREVMAAPPPLARSRILPATQATKRDREFCCRFFLATTSSFMHEQSRHSILSQSRVLLYEVYITVIYALDSAQEERAIWINRRFNVALCDRPCRI